MYSCLVEPSVPISTQIKKGKSPSNRAFLLYSAATFFWKKSLNFLLGEHLVDQLEDGLSVLVLQLLD